MRTSFTARSGITRSGPFDYQRSEKLKFIIGTLVVTHGLSAALGAFVAGPLGAFVGGAAGMSSFLVAGAIRGAYAAVRDKSVQEAEQE